MNNESGKEQEIAEIKLRIDYLLEAKEVSDAEKVEILKRALEIMGNVI